ncbi:MAG: division/cell wall cluster transcriptional repressor MraZ [Gammaproteobacteria bacterium]|nr:division/cell wall cluster transcriptional repressor MraZ [Gammaproteobacteria bacterium]NIO61873.1 division/cell wall cluster transcriptional repressor MraZ [Gammaproteobacteria bacterium]NIT41724.1 division/cell wall cluster transcriptional repressor MraZ [Gammaproteobacteria bacterium]
MFRGSSTVSIDIKGRLAVPSRFRDRLKSEAGGCLVQTLNPLDRSLWLYPLNEWELIENKLAALSDFDKQSRRAKQMMRGYATDCRLDSQGRILLSQELRDYASIKKQVLILGQGNKFEIWDQATWEEQRDIWLEQVGDENSEPSEALKPLSL